ncbi:hypothetical protein U1Q18_021806 [Sarracenia purpurea var. burkii]
MTTKRSQSVLSSRSEFSSEVCATRLRVRRPDCTDQMRSRRSDDTTHPSKCLEVVLGQSAMGRRKSTWAWPLYKAVERSTSCRIPPTICLVASEDYGYKNLVFFHPRSKPSSVKIARTRKSFFLLRSRDWGFVAG